MANALLTRIYDPNAYNPLLINKKIVSVSYAHEQSFVPTQHPNHWTTYSTVDEHGYRTCMIYWDDTSYATLYPLDESAMAGQNIDTRTSVLPPTTTLQAAPAPALQFQLDSFYSSIEADLKSFQYLIQNLKRNESNLQSTTRLLKRAEMEPDKSILRPQIPKMTAMHTNCLLFYQS